MKLLTTKELREGNKIIANDVYQGKIMTFDRFNEDKTVCFFSDGHKWGIGEYLKDCEPVVLTEDILLACGYSDCAFRENHFVIKGHSIWKCNEMFLCDKNGVILKTLNQLQNLYFALTNQELDFKPI